MNDVTTAPICDEPMAQGGRGELEERQHTRLQVCNSVYSIVLKNSVCLLVCVKNLLKASSGLSGGYRTSAAPLKPAHLRRM